MNEPREMMKILPGYYHKSTLIQTLYDVLAQIWGSVTADTTGAAMNLHIASGSVVDLTRHNADVGLPSTNESVENVIARLQGWGTFTVEALIELVAVYGYDCTVSEDYGSYTVTLEFTDSGIPDEIDDIMAAIEIYKPAHIKMTYEYKPFTWGDAKLWLGDWGNADLYTWDGARWHLHATRVEIDGDAVYESDTGNASVEFDGIIPYAVSD